MDFFQSALMIIDSLIMTPSTFEIVWETYRPKIIIGVTIIALVLFITLGTLLVRRSQRITSNALFTDATEIVGWQKVVDRYPHSEAAANALLLIAAAQRQEHHLDVSNTTYTAFLKKFPQHPLAISALLGKAANQECADQADQSLDTYQQAALVYSKSYAAPFALLNRARLLALLGKTDEAKRAVQLISSQYPNSIVTTMVLRQGAVR